MKKNPVNYENKNSIFASNDRSNFQIIRNVFSYYNIEFDRSAEILIKKNK